MLSHQIINVFSPLFAFNLHSKAYIAYKQHKDQEETSRSHKSKQLTFLLCALTKRRSRALVLVASICLCVRAITEKILTQIYAIL